MNLNLESFQNWALRHFGTTNINPNADADRAGVINYQEYLAGTDPLMWRPSYLRSARPEIAIPFYEKFLTRLAQDFGKPVQTGEFGADILLRLANDSPVTIIIDSKRRE